MGFYLFFRKYKIARPFSKQNILSSEVAFICIFTELFHFPLNLYPIYTAQGLTRLDFKEVC